MSRRVAVIGAGWSGLACALTIAEGGARVALIDAAPQPGGRARRVEIALGDTTYALDNGQHLLLGAYRETLRLIERVGLDRDRVLLRRPFELRYPDGCVLQARRWPAPLHLAAALMKALGFSLADRISIARDVHAWRRSGWHASDAASARSITRFATPAVVRRVWNPLCLAALNVPLEAASASIFLNVLRDSLGACAEASELMLPRRDLSALFPDAALQSLQRCGAELLHGQAAALRRRSGWTVELGDRLLDVDAVVLALPPPRAAALLATAGLPALGSIVEALQRIEMAPIATVYLRYATGTRLVAPMLALRADPAAQRYGQWVFDRGALDLDCAGVLAVVVSGDGPHRDLDRAALAAAAAHQLTDELALPPPLAYCAIVEKRATIQPRPGLRRPPTQLPAAGLFLAGDSADSPYPSTLEGSVRAGIAAAHAALNA
jgi:squalene-associated FAD-dependent desaturase